MKLLAVVLVSLGLSGAACDKSLAQLDESTYENKASGLDRIVRERLKDLSSDAASGGLGQQLEANRSLAETAETVVGRLRELRPPERYEAGHTILIEFYVETQRFFSLEAERVSIEIAGNDTADIMDQAARSANRLLELRRQILEALPFLDQSTPPLSPAM